jgi:enoyl-CoA hydratase/carnithine racemase
MDDIVTERSEGILRVKLNRPEKRNAMTSSMYMKLADIFNDTARDERIRVVLWHGAGEAFSAGNDVEDFLQNPPGPGDSPQARLMNALLDFNKPMIAAVRGAAIGGGTTMQLHCDFVHAGESTRFQMPFPAAALQASKQLLKRSLRAQLIAAMRAENEAFSARIRSEEAKEALTAFLEKRPPDFSRTSRPAAAA